MAALRTNQIAYLKKHKEGSEKKGHVLSTPLVCRLWLWIPDAGIDGIEKFLDPDTTLTILIPY